MLLGPQPLMQSQQLLGLLNLTFQQWSGNGEPGEGPLYCKVGPVDVVILGSKCVRVHACVSYSCFRIGGVMHHMHSLIQTG